MILWLDAQLPPQLASWLREQFSVEVAALRDLGLREATDPELFEAAREANAIIVTKDKDFVELVTRRGIPPRVLWITCGNTSNARLREILTDALPQALERLEKDEPVIEIGNESTRA